MTVPSRREAREWVASLVKARSSTAQAVYAYLPADFGGASPIVVITGSGSERTRATMRGSKTKFHLAVEIFVLYADPDATPPWTEEDAENALDALEEEIADVVANNPASSHYNMLAYETTSVVSKVTVGGVGYLYESIPLSVEVI